MHHQHISDHAIYERLQVDIDAQPPSEIVDCEICQQNYRNSKAVFTAIQATSQQSPGRSLWNEIILKRQLDQQKKRGRVSNWVMGAVAAVAMVSMGVQWHILNSDHTVQNQIQASILQSQQLEKIYVAYQSKVRLSATDSAMVAQELLFIDEALQQAYLENAPLDKILQLWQKRVDFLVESLSEDNQETMLVTI